MSDRYYEPNPDSIFAPLFERIKFLNPAGKTAAKVAHQRMRDAELAMRRLLNEVGSVLRESIEHEMFSGKVDPLYLAELLQKRKVRVVMLIHAESDGIPIMERQKFEVTVDKEIMDPDVNPFRKRREE